MVCFFWTHYFVFLNPFLVLVCLPKWTWKLNHAKNVFLADSYGAILWHSKLQVADAEARNDETRRFQLDPVDRRCFWSTRSTATIPWRSSNFDSETSDRPNSAKIAACIMYRPWAKWEMSGRTSCKCLPKVSPTGIQDATFLGRQTSFWLIRAKPC